MKNNYRQINFNFGNSQKTYMMLLDFLENNNFNMLPNYPFEHSYDETIEIALVLQEEKNNNELIEKLEDYSRYCLCNLHEVIQVNN